MHCNILLKNNNELVMSLTAMDFNHRSRDTLEVGSGWGRRDTSGNGYEKE
jgi:hypothetical protein